MNLYSKIVLWSSIVILSWACNSQSPASDAQHKGSLFIIGGGSRPATMVQQMVDASHLASTGGYGIVLPMASSQPDTSAYYGMLQFQQLGVNNIHTYNFADTTLPDVRQKLDSLQKAALIYIPGGVQDRFMQAVSRTPGLEKALHEAYAGGALIAGTSAGAAVMSKIMITGDQKKYPEYTSTFYHLERDNLVTEKGLGLITGVIIDQHFLVRARNNRLLTAVLEYPDHIGIGIDESTAILVHNNAVKVIGKSQVLVYRNLSDTIEGKEGKIAAKNIRLDIYLPGDTFVIR